MRPEAQTINTLVTRALASYDQRPDADAVAALIDDLITAGQELHTAVSQVPQGLRTERATAALEEWSYIVDVGPRGHGDHANWNHARGLARIARTMSLALGQHQQSCAQ
jgi:hypothetical protein